MMLGWLSFGLACVAVGVAIYSLYASRRTEQKWRAMEKLRAEHEQAAEVSRKADAETEKAFDRLGEGFTRESDQS